MTSSVGKHETSYTAVQTVVHSKIPRYIYLFVVLNPNLNHIGLMLAKMAAFFILIIIYLNNQKT